MRVLKGNHGQNNVRLCIFSRKALGVRLCAVNRANTVSHVRQCRVKSTKIASGSKSDKFLF